MTVCISAICEHGEKIVSATDGLVTLGGITADVLPGKLRWFNDWQIAYAGNTGNVGLFMEELRRIDFQDHDAFSRERIQDTLRLAYNSFRSKQCAHAVLGPLGIKLEDLNTDGVKRFGESNVADFQRRMDEYSRQYISDQFLVSGWAEYNGHAAMVCVVAPEYTASDEVSGCMATGSGGEVALSTMLMLGQSRDASLSETLYRVAAAKFMSESSADEFVGRKTTMFVSWKRRDSDRKDKPAGMFLRRDYVKELRSLWERLGRPKIPDEGQMLASSIAGKMGLASAHDMMHSVAAATRIFKSSGARIANAEEDDSGPNRATDEDREASE